MPGGSVYIKWKNTNKMNKTQTDGVSLEISLQSRIFVWMMNRVNRFYWSFNICIFNIAETLIKGVSKSWVVSHYRLRMRVLHINLVILIYYSFTQCFNLCGIHRCQRNMCAKLLQTQFLGLLCPCGITKEMWNIRTPRRPVELWQWGKFGNKHSLSTVLWKLQERWDKRSKLVHSDE
jgi:hypothetical protein